MLLIGAYEGRSLLSRMIQWETRSSISHISVVHVPDHVWNGVELAVNLHAFETLKETFVVYEAWGSLTRPHKSGVFKRVGLSTGHTPGTLIHLLRVRECAYVCEDTVLRYLESAVGRNYDYGGLVRFLTRRDKGDADRLFCSELAMRAIHSGGVDLLARVSMNMVSPGMVYNSPLLLPFKDVTTMEASHDIV